ncbi:hypothetical protein ACVI1J_003594 [Bradyrhizobium diazoefficiens]
MTGSDALLREAQIHQVLHFIERCASKFAALPRIGWHGIGAPFGIFVACAHMVVSA